MRDIGDGMQPIVENLVETVGVLELAGGALDIAVDAKMDTLSINSVTDVAKTTAKNLAIGKLKLLRNIPINEDMLKGSLSMLVVAGGGKIDVSILKSHFVPEGLRNIFNPNDDITAGQKYFFKLGKTKIGIKWHSPHKKWVGVAGSNSGAGWSAQISVNKFFLKTNGDWTKKFANNDTHIPVIRE